MRFQLSNKRNYLELKVPVRQDAEWLSKLREAMEANGIAVKWQNGWYHITVAFINDDCHMGLLKTAFDKVIRGAKAPEITLNKLGVFMTRGGMQLVVYLTTSKMSDSLNTLIESLRNEAKSIGANFDQDFRLHISLGRIDAHATSLEKARDVVAGISIPKFTLTIKEAEYRYFRDKSICKWEMA